MLNGQSFTVIGVAPAEFGGAQLGVTRDLYVPMMMQAVMRPPRAGNSGEMNPDLLKVWTNSWLFTLARLKPGVSVEQAQTALTIIAEAHEQPSSSATRRPPITVTRVSDGDTLERVEAVPGVESASLARVVVLTGASSVRSLLVEGRSGPDNQFRSEGTGVGSDSINSVRSNVVGLNYFQTMGITFSRGRDFNAADTQDRPRVVIVNDAFERLHFGGQGAVGKRLSFGNAQGPWCEIVGVVRDSKYQSLTQPDPPAAYLPLIQNHETGMTLHVRTTGNPSAAAASVRQEIQSLEKNLPVTNVRPMTELIADSLYAARMGAILLGSFGSLALLLAAVGLYGVMSFSVSVRTRELGIRLALGARASDVLALVLKEGMYLVAIGVVLGLGVAALVTRLLASFLFGIGPTDLVTFASVPAVLMGVALLACYIPARRATKVDPLRALRYE